MQHPHSAHPHTSSNHVADAFSLRVGVHHSGQQRKTLLPIDTRPDNSQPKAKEASLRASTSWWWRGIVDILTPVPWVRLHGTSGDLEPGDVASKFRKDSWLQGNLLTDIRSTQLSSEKGSPQLLFSIHWLTRSFITAQTIPLMTKQGPAGLTKLETHQTNLYSLI